MKTAEMLDKITQTVEEPSYSSDSSVYSDSEMEEESCSESSESAFEEEMYPNLSTGAINRILNFEDVPGAVLQILGFKKIPGAGIDRYRFWISDGVTGCIFVMLGSRLNHMVTNKEVEKFAIVRVDKCVCNEVGPGRKIIILLRLTVLVPGNEVNEKLGNPINPPPTNDSDSSVYSDSAMEEESCSESSESAFEGMYPNLTNGAINRILNFEDVPGPILQIIAYKKIPGGIIDRYRLLISDGVTGSPYVMLGTQLNQMVTNKEVEKFAIVRVDKCVCNQVEPGRKIIILLRLTVLVPGNQVNEKLGNPICPPPTDNDQITPTRPVTNGRPPSMDETQPIR